MTSHVDDIPPTEHETMFLHFCGCGYKRVVNEGDYPPVICPQCKKVRTVAYMSARRYNYVRCAKIVVNSLLLFSLVNFGCFASTERENYMYSDNVITESCVLPNRRFDTPVLTGVAGEALVKGNTLICRWPSGPTNNVVWKSRTPFYMGAEPEVDYDVYVGVALDSVAIGMPIKYAVTGMLVDVRLHVATVFGGNPVPPGTLLTLTDENAAEPIGLARFWDWPMDHGVLNPDYMKTIIGHLACAYDPGVIAPPLVSDLVPVVLHPFVLPWTATP